MRPSPTDVIFIWHMHQPYYKEPGEDTYLLPWVRLHGIKDYYGMAKTIDAFDTVKATFNFSGILLHQLQEYVQGAQDTYGILSTKDSRHLSNRERNFIIDRFFSVTYDRHIRPNKRYVQLHQKRSTNRKKFTPQDISDLQVIFNLCWFHPYTINEDKHLQEIAAKKKHYSQDDKRYIIDKHYEILKKIFPLYKRLLDAKRIELSVTPYMHPIMPLLYDTDVLKEMPYLKKPQLRFSRPEDCHWHLRRTKEIFRDIFERDIRGSWPSEGSVSEGVLRIYNKEGFNWVGTDEGILFKTLTTEFVPYDMIKNQRHIIYRPYNFNGVNIFFRDRNLADALSFTYQGWEDPVFAANDFLEHSKRIHYYVRPMLKRRAITVIMDGENAWEYYRNNGVEFLETIYGALEKSAILSSCTPSEFLAKEKGKHLERLGSGSWINSDFGVWIGSKKNNHNWHILRKLRDTIEKYKKDREKREKLFEYFYIIEGSDWNWWNTFEDITGDFAKIFLSYVREIYKILAKKPPSYIMKKQ